MPAEKTARQSVTRYQRNRSVRAATRTALRRARTAVNEAPDTAGNTVRQALSALDRAAKKGVLHKNNASRRKSRLMRRLNQEQG